MDASQFIEDWNSPDTHITVQTSGSTGTPKPIRVEKKRMVASALMTCNYLSVKEGDSALLCLSPDYIAGKMMIVRSLVRRLNLTIMEPTGNPLANDDGHYDLAAMVPMQVFNILSSSHGEEKLNNIRHLIIGGGAIHPMLEKKIAMLTNSTWSSYGMTETLSDIALRRINGKEASQWYTPFDNVSVKLSTDGCLIINAPAVCPESVITNDMAEIAPDGRRFKILGRRDNVICSGGMKIHIEDIEQRIAAYTNIIFAIGKRKDPKLGEAMVLVTEGNHEQELRDICTRILPSILRPKEYVATKHIPTTGTGKPARALINSICQTTSSFLEV